MATITQTASAGTATDRVDIASAAALSRETTCQRQARAAKPRRAAEEIETVIRWDDASENAVLWTGSAVVARAWRRRGIDIAEHAGGWWATVPKAWIRIARPRSANRGSFGRRPERREEPSA